MADIHNTARRLYRPYSSKKCKNEGAQPKQPVKTKILKIPKFSIYLARSQGYYTSDSNVKPKNMPPHGTTQTFFENTFCVFWNARRIKGIVRYAMRIQYGQYAY